MKAFSRQPIYYAETQTLDRQDGMDLRDYFAAQAMNGLIHHFDFGTFRDDPLRVARWAYDAADAMMKAREEPHD